MDLIDAKFSQPDKQALLRGLLAILPKEAVLHEREALKPYECDALTVYRNLPLAVVLPSSEEQVAAILRLCRDLAVPVVARGAGTGLSGGAMPHDQGIVLSMAKFNRILSIDPLSRTARVQPGVRNLAISDAARPSGLYFAPDPSSQIACTIGGNVAENSGGVHCLKYGLTVHNILAVRAYTIDGDLLEIGGGALDAPGFDLLALVTGSEGLLCVITEVTVRLLPTPVKARAVLAAFDRIEQAGQAVADVIAAGIIPAAMEIMDKAVTRVVEDYVHAGYPLDAEAILIVESDGTEEEVEDEIERIGAVLQRAGASQLRVSQSEEERYKIWSGRKSAFSALGRFSADYYCIDGTVPRKQLATILRAIGQMEKKYGLRCANVFHAGDGNLHPLIMFDASKPGELERTEAFAAEILELSVALGGTITGEHGVGVEKINQMCVQFAQPELQMFHAVKRAFDSSGLLNPGKAVPALHRCAEYGRMHVHSATPAHPELLRF
ncbi:MAG TPA: FAD-linked oxidase C-terminal domain-containing protein [Burkholderiaceae bacterium]|nr:FAD-linked oxidase C-terminal domain-containing protein [Burkholderiaceae bacterium]